MRLYLLKCFIIYLVNASAWIIIKKGKTIMGFIVRESSLLTLDKVIFNALIDNKNKSKNNIFLRGDTRERKSLIFFVDNVVNSSSDLKLFT